MTYEDPLVGKAMAEAEAIWNRAYSGTREFSPSVLLEIVKAAMRIARDDKWAESR